MKANSIIKKYPNGLLKVKRTKFQFDVGSKQRKDMIHYDISEYEQIKKDIRDGFRKQDEEEYKFNKIKDNLVKTKSNIYDIANCNEWNYFITLTFNSEKCDRYSFNETSKKIRKFMNNYKNKNDSEFKYLIVHETHKDGAYHYHGLVYLSNQSKMVDSGKKDKQKRIIYNWSSWKNGFSTVTEIGNLDKTRNYILKYIEKDISKNYVKGQRRYYYSRSCEKPLKEVSLNYPIDDMELSYETNYSVGYESVDPQKHEELLKKYLGEDIEYLEV